MKNRLHKYILSLFIVFIVFTFQGYAQNELKVDIVLIVDNELVTSGVEMNFVSKEGEVLLNHSYTVGKELITDIETFYQEVYLEFDYIGKDSSKNFETYHYKIEFPLGYVYNTKFAVIRIYNLDKKEFKEAFCKSAKDYIVNIENQVYTQGTIQCKEFKQF